MVNYLWLMEDGCERREGEVSFLEGMEMGFLGRLKRQCCGVVIWTGFVCLFVRRGGVGDGCVGGESRLEGRVGRLFCRNDSRL